jgi:hypothetical protein
MRTFRNGVIIGVAAGYVLGARAGRERYEQIARAASAAWGSKPATMVRAEVSKAIPDAVTSIVDKIAARTEREPDSMAMGASRLPA